MKTELKSILTKETLRQYAGGRSYERGEAYYDEGVVSSLVERNGKVTATVRGSENYAVKLWAEDEDGGCSNALWLTQPRGVRKSTRQTPFPSTSGWPKQASMKKQSRL